jgi:hypothetical protein
MINNSLPNDVVRVVSHLLEDLDTPISLGVFLRIRHGEWDGILELNPDPRQYLDPSSYFRDAAAASILKKLKELPGTIDRRDSALQKWRDGEKRCFLTNERLRRYTDENRLFDDRCGAISDFLSDVRKIILSWIGYGPDQLALGRFGPGATFSNRGGKTTVPDKMSTDPSLTRDAIWYLPQWLNTQWGADFAQRHGEFSFVPGNRFTTVPKTAKTDRSIAVEPSINVFYQLALGRQLRQRLARRPRKIKRKVKFEETQIDYDEWIYAGWDLDRAQDVHRQVAETSSVTREFATLDLSNASDTVAKTLVEVLLPRGWFQALDDLRSKKTLVDGQWVYLEKFSSMGNGFTFELETILFAAIACAVSRKGGCLGMLGVDVFVFGDDIIVKNEVAMSLKSVLEFLGFELNAEKSYFDDSPFRESCGADYFAGKPVRPHYLKELPNGPQDFVSFANGISNLIERATLSGRSIGRRAWFAALDCIPTRVRSCRGPKDLGDIVIHDVFERWTCRWRGGIRYIKALRPHRVRVIPYERFRGQVVLACATYGVGNYRGGVIPRDGVLSYKVGWVPRS